MNETSVSNSYAERLQNADNLLFGYQSSLTEMRRNYSCIKITTLKLVKNHYPSAHFVEKVAYWSDKMGGEFYKYDGPCHHSREGDTWREEIGVNERQLRTAKTKTATRIHSGESKSEALDPLDADGKLQDIDHLVIYWRNRDNQTVYLFNRRLYNLHLLIANGDVTREQVEASLAQSAPILAPAEVPSVETIAFRHPDAELSFGRPIPTILFNQDSKNKQDLQNKKDSSFFFEDKNLAGGEGQASLNAGLEPSSSQEEESSGKVQDTPPPFIPPPQIDERDTTVSRLAQPKPLETTVSKMYAAWDTAVDQLEQVNPQLYDLVGKTYLSKSSSGNVFNIGAPSHEHCKQLRSPEVYPALCRAIAEAFGGPVKLEFFVSESQPVVIPTPPRATWKERRRTS